MVFFMNITLNCDYVGIYGPKTDGGYRLTFLTGEYEQEKIAKIITIPQGQNIKLEIYVEDSN